MLRVLAPPIRIVAITCGLLASATPARATVTNTWVSGTGVNTPNCPITAPCATFAYALTQTTAGGTINVLTSGSFGPVIITKSVSIIAEGVEARIQTVLACPAPNSFNAAICVTALAADVVNLRGLIIELQGGSDMGISLVTAAALHVQNSLFRRSFLAIRFVPSVASALHMSDSKMADNVTGIGIAPTGAASAKVVLDRVHVENNLSNGINFNGSNTGSIGNIDGTVRDSVVAGTGGDGIYITNTNAGAMRVMIERTAVVNNIAGIHSDGTGATVRIGDSTITGNGTGLLSTSSGQILSYGTNKVDGNGTDGTPTGPVLYK